MLNDDDLSKNILSHIQAINKEQNPLCIPKIGYDRPRHDKI